MFYDQVFSSLFLLHSPFPPSKRLLEPNIFLCSKIFFLSLIDFVLQMGSGFEIIIYFRFCIMMDMERLPLILFLIEPGLYTLTYLTQAIRVDLEKVHLISDFTRFTTDCHSLFSQPSHLDIGAAPIFASQSIGQVSVGMKWFWRKTFVVYSTLRDCCSEFQFLYILLDLRKISVKEVKPFFILMYFKYMCNRYKHSCNSAVPWIKSQKIKKLKARKKPKRRTPWIIMCSKWGRTSK